MEITTAVIAGEYGEIIAEFSHLEFFLKLRYGLSVADIEITETPGYWRVKTPCDGRGKCNHPLHGVMFNEGGLSHTVRYLDSGRNRHGQFESPYKTWELWKKIVETVQSLSLVKEVSA